MLSLYKFYIFIFLFRFLRTRYPSIRNPKFKHKFWVFRAYSILLKTYIFTDLLKATTNLIIESNISETGFQHLEIQVISVHAFENKICTLMYVNLHPVNCIYISKRKKRPILPSTGRQVITSNRTEL